MRRWITNINYRLREMMYGRYGYDELNRFLSISALIFIILALFFPQFNTLALLLLAVSLYRTYSKNIARRQKELADFLYFKSKFNQTVLRQKNKFRDRKTHRYFTCPMCKAHLRVPKGKGKIEICCAKCRHKFIKRT